MSPKTLKVTVAFLFDRNCGKFKGFCLNPQDHPDFGGALRPIFIDKRYRGSAKVNSGEPMIVDLELIEGETEDDSVWVAVPDPRERESIIKELDRLSAELGEKTGKLKAVERRTAELEGKQAEFNGIEEKIKEKLRQFENIEKVIAPRELHLEKLLETKASLNKEISGLRRALNKLTKKTKRKETELERQGVSVDDLLAVPDEEEAPTETMAEAVS